MAALPDYVPNFRVTGVDLKALANEVDPLFNSQNKVTAISKHAFEKNLLEEAVRRSGSKFFLLGHTHAALAKTFGAGPNDANANQAAVAAFWKVIVYLLLFRGLLAFRRCVTESACRPDDAAAVSICFSVHRHSRSTYPPRRCASCEPSPAYN